MGEFHETRAEIDREPVAVEQKRRPAAIDREEA
jgi:hypothetical protein